MRKILLVISALFFFISCKEKEKQSQEINFDNNIIYNILNDENIQKILDYSDRRQSDSLLPFLSSPNEEIRKIASIQFASIQDSNYVDTLSFLLNDSDPSVRINTAWSLAQTTENGQLQAILTRLEQEENHEVRQSLLEALGKIIDQENIGIMESLDLLEYDDLGYAAGSYAMSYRGINSDLIFAKNFNNYSIENKGITNIYLTQYFSNCNEELLGQNRKKILDFFKSETNNDVKIGWIKVLRKIKHNDVDDLFREILINDENEDNINLLTETLRAVSRREQNQWRTFGQLVYHENENVAITAVSCIPGSNFKPNAIRKDSIKLTPRVKAAFFRACSEQSPKLNWMEEMKSFITEESDPYTQSHYLRALGSDANQIDFLMEQFERLETIPAKSACVDALVEIRSTGGMNMEIFDNLFTKVMKSGDVGSICILMNHMRVMQNNPYRKFKESVLFEEALDKLEIPRDLEAQFELNHTLAFLKGAEWSNPSSEYNHPINWDRAMKIEPNQKVKIETSVGDIFLELDIENAPGSACNFVELIESGFFDQKTFHRVVPNFVIQTGCPRGDGFGSVDFSIRSEFGIHRYRSGAVGMASAGQDTESCQWFITHVPTPFLEGRYTIFAYVVKGMDVVNKIKMGDRIKHMSLVDGI